MLSDTAETVCASAEVRNKAQVMPRVLLMDTGDTGTRKQSRKGWESFVLVLCCSAHFPGTALFGYTVAKQEIVWKKKMHLISGLCSQHS